MNTSVSVKETTYTRAHTAVHLADVILGTFSEIVARLGMSSSYLTRHFKLIEEGLITWIKEGSLEEVYLECGTASRPEAIFEIPIDYKVGGSGDVEFVANRARAQRVMAKLTDVPAGTEYRVVVSHNTAFYTKLDGWSSTSRYSTEGMSSYSLGGIGSGPGAGASLRQWSRS